MDTDQSCATPNAGIRPSRYGLAEHGIRNINIAYWNLGSAQLLEHAVRRHEGLFAKGGAYVVGTGQFTGRSPTDKFIVRDETTEAAVQWGPVNQPMAQASFDRLYSKVLAYWQGHDLFVQDCFAGADPRYTLPIRVIAQYAWHALFARQLFVRPDPLHTQEHVPEFTILFAPGLQATPSEDGTNSETCIVINFTKKVVLICGTQLRGRDEEVRLHHSELPAAGARHLAHALFGQRGKRRRRGAVFRPFGHGQDHALRRPAAPPDRRRRAWLERPTASSISKAAATPSASGFRRENEPQIWNAIRFGTVLENVAMDAGDAAARFRFRRQHHREYPRRLSARLHRQRR